MSVAICGRGCSTQNKNSGGRCADRDETYIGMVLCTFERNFSDDSDFYALVWDDEKGACRNVEYASTRGWTYHNGANVDATRDVEMIARHSFRDIVRRKFIGDVTAAVNEVAIGARVVSTTKRGKNVGVVGTVRRRVVDDSKSNRWNTHYRLGVDVGEDKLRWLDADRVERVDVAPIDVSAIHARADAWLECAGWRTLAELV